MAQNFFTKIVDFGCEEDKYLSTSMYYTGGCKPKEAKATVQWLETNEKAMFIDWTPNGFHIRINEELLWM